MSTEPKQRNVVATRIFEAPVERVWRAWSEPEQVKQWWGPHGFTVPVADMDFREGGMSLVAMRAPAEYGGQDMYNTWTYSKIVPYERLEFVNNFSDAAGARLDPALLPGLPAGIPLNVPHVITFKPAGSNRTEMTITEYGYTTDEAHDMSLAGLEQVLDKLAASVKQGTQETP